MQEKLEENKEMESPYILDLIKDQNIIEVTDANELALHNYAQAFQKIPTENVKDRIKARFSKLTAQSKNRNPISLERPPLLDSNSNLLDWEQALAHIVPPEEFDHIYLQVLYSDDTRELLLGWSREIIPEEVHEDLIESFLILDGTCECHIWNEEDPTKKRIVHMVAGDFLQLELHESHDVITTSLQPVKAILQRLKV